MIRANIADKWQSPTGSMILPERLRQCQIRDKGITRTEMFEIMLIGLSQQSDKLVFVGLSPELTVDS